MTKEKMSNEKAIKDTATSENIIYILDTNILLHEPFAFLSFEEHDVVVPMTVLEELDSIKERRKDVSRDARVAIRALEDTLTDATPEQVLAGVKLPESDEQVSILDLGHERLMGKSAWGIHPKNIYQGMAMDALLDPNIDLVILTGPAGCGKMGITSTIISIFVQTSVKIKSLAQFLQKNIIKNFSFTNQIKTPSKLFLGECYV